MIIIVIIIITSWTAGWLVERCNIAYRNMVHVRICVSFYMFYLYLLKVN